MSSAETAIKIGKILEREFSGAEIQIEDQSHFHAGHREAGGGGHFFVTIQSARFNGLSPIERQRLVISVMKPLMDTEIHALSLKCIATS